MSRLGKYVVLFFPKFGIFSAIPTEMGLKTKSLKLANIQARLIKKIFKNHSAIAIGQYEEYLDLGGTTLRAVPKLWVVPWPKEENTLDSLHEVNPALAIKDEDFYDN